MCDRGYARESGKELKDNSSLPRGKTIGLVLGLRAGAYRPPAPSAPELSAPLRTRTVGGRLFSNMRPCTQPQHNAQATHPQPLQQQQHVTQQPLPPEEATLLQGCGAEFRLAGTRRALWELDHFAGTVGRYRSVHRSWKFLSPMAAGIPVFGR